jgi:hypothetical protein
LTPAKPELPRPRATYRVSQDRKEYEDSVATAPKAFVVWANVEGALLSAAVMLSRVASHGVTVDRWVEFEAVPEGHTADGTPFHSVEGVLDTVIGCDWSTYLKLVRRKMGAGSSQRDGHLATLVQSSAGKGAVGRKFKDDQAWTLHAVGK